MDEVIAKIAGFGVPGLVLVVAMSATGFAGAAAVTTALSAMGGPLGMVGGVAALGLLGYISNAITKYGFTAVYKGVIKELVEEEGMTEDEIIDKIDGYPISSNLKMKLKNLVSDYFDE